MSFAVKELFVKEYCSRDEDGVTIKYSAEYSNNFKEELHNFVQEANRLYRICKGNDNIVNVNEVFQANGTAYYVMDNITGGNLRSLCHGVPLPESRVLALMEPIAKAVEYVHNQHYMHFDIKPDNIMLRQNSDGSESPVLIDFGISMHFNDRGNTTGKYAPGTSAGYSPKEQYEPITKFTPAIDVYALAATYFYLLTGHDPVISQQVYPGYVAKQLPLDVSEVTRQAIAEGMKPLWYERPQSVAKFLAGFRESYTLKQGYILKSPHLSYYIFSVEDESSCYIHYKAVPYHGSSYNGNDANVTQTTIYDIYECFVAKFMSRAKDGSIQMPDGMTTLPSFAQFNDLAKRWSGLDEMGKDKDLPLSCEWFKANNTQYVVVKKGFKPISPITSVIKNIGNQIYKNKKRYGIANAAILLAVGLGYGIYYEMSASMNNEVERELELKLSSMLTSAIESNDSTVLLKFADADSLRAYLPLANICLHAYDTIKARHYAEMALKHKPDDGYAKIIIAKIGDNSKLQKGTMKNPSFPKSVAITELEDNIRIILSVDKNKYTDNNKYGEYLHSLLQACMLNNELKRKAQEKDIRYMNFDQQIKQKVQAEYKSNLEAINNEYLPAVAKKTCEEYINQIKAKGKGYY